jgi:deoxyribodipyrimidine photolyase-like uncharacterized protein
MRRFPPSIVRAIDDGCAALSPIPRCVRIPPQEATMAHTYHELRQMTVAQLRDVAKELSHQEVQGYSQMNKERLLPALCRALNIETLEHHTADGVDKPAIKARMRELKQERGKALTAHDHAQLKNIRRQMHALNRQIRSHMS